MDKDRLLVMAVGLIAVGLSGPGRSSGLIPGGRRPLIISCIISFIWSRPIIICIIPPLEAIPPLKTG